MGAEYGTDMTPIADVKEAYDDLREIAQYEHGHGGYTGSIAESSGYHIYQHHPVSLVEAQALAEELRDRDDGPEKWEEAFAIPVLQSEDNPLKIAWVFCGWYSS